MADYPGYDLEPEDKCPNCGHVLTSNVHSKDGCLNGWEWDPDGVPLVEGCLCPLMIATGS